MASSTSGYSKQNSLAELMVARINLIWQMGEASLSANGDEHRIPLRMGKQLQAFEIEELEKRLSRKYNDAPTFHFEDLKLEVLHICALPTSPDGPYTPDTSMSSPSTSSPAEASNAAAQSVMESAKVGGSKKNKVPRPPNAFILYRKKWHPKIKEQNPKMHNNDISVLLGKQWKTETHDVKQSFRDMAEKIKVKHAADNPGYKYAPRKPSEKKRRMTARKLARMQENAAQSEYADLHGIGDTNPIAQSPLPDLEDLIGIGPPRGAQMLPTFDPDGSVHFHIPWEPNELHGVDLTATYAQNHSEIPNYNMPVMITNSNAAHVHAAAEFLNSLISLEAMDSVPSLNNVNLGGMTSVDETDDQLPHLAPLGAAEFFSAQAEFDNIAHLLP